MSEWEGIFGEEGMQDGFLDSEIVSWSRQEKLEQSKVTLFFDTAADALNWAKAHPGSTVSPHPDNEGYIARTWQWSFEGVTNVGTRQNAVDAMIEENRQTQFIRSVQIEMGLSRKGALWLFHSGHEPLLTKLYADRANWQHMADRRREIKTMLVNLLPSNIEDLDNRKIRGVAAGKASYVVRKSRSGWPEDADYEEKAEKLRNPKKLDVDNIFGPRKFK